MTRFAQALLALLLVVAAAAGCATGKDAVVRGSGFEFVAPGGKTDIFYEGPQRQALPALAGEDLMNEGKQLSLSDFAGKVVVINLWGQWCAPCRTEAPEMEKVYRQAGPSGVQVLGIDVRDFDRQPPQDFLRDRGLTYPSIYDPPGRTLLPLAGYPRNVVPSTIIVDRQHRVAAVFLRDLLATDVLPVVQRLAGES
jgi:thiol-disulfide isomerase/thioredoxin